MIFELVRNLNIIHERSTNLGKWCITYLWTRWIRTVYYNFSQWSL